MYLNQFTVTKNFEFLSDKDIFIFPGSVWATKKWQEEGFIRAAQTLIGLGYKIHWMGSKDEADLCERLQSQTEGSVSHAGKLSLIEVAMVLRNAKLLLCNDSGSMHLGSLVGVPTVAMFGPTTLNLGYRPWHENAIVEQIDLDCRPCGKHGHSKCPLGHHNCMKLLNPEDVLKSASKLLIRDHQNRSASK